MKRLFQYSEPDEALISARRKDAQDYQEFLAESARESMRFGGPGASWCRDAFSDLYNAPDTENRRKGPSMAQLANEGETAMDRMAAAFAASQEKGKR